VRQPHSVVYRKAPDLVDEERLWRLKIECVRMPLDRHSSA